MSTHVRAEQLRAAVVAMATRYGDSCQDYAYAVAGSYHADERARLLRAHARRFAALQRLTRALANLAGGAS